MTTQSDSSYSLRKFEKVCEILKKHDNNPNKLIPILQEVQEEYRYLPQEVLTFVATSVNLPPARVYGVATFYAHFALEPKGKYVIKVCDGTACHVKESIPIVDAIMKKLGIDYNKRTTNDMLFTLETVSCLGACGLAPVVVINEEVHPMMSPKKIVDVLDQIIEKEKANENAAC